MAVFLRRDLIWYVSLPEESSLSVRPGAAFKTKGAVATAFMIFGTSFLFVTAHLTAHQEKVKERVSDVKKIVNCLDLPKNLPIKNKSKGKNKQTTQKKSENPRLLHYFLDVTQNFDYVFWAGDLNFRLATPRAKVLEWLSNTKFPLPTHLPHGYMHHDQLCSVLSAGAAFKGFREANIRFPPTYKVTRQQLAFFLIHFFIACYSTMLALRISIRPRNSAPQPTRIEFCINKRRFVG